MLWTKWDKQHRQGTLPAWLWPVCGVIAVFIMVWYIPCPDGLTNQNWTLVAIFFATVAAIIFKVLPIGAIAVIAMVAISVSHVTAPTSRQAVGDALSSFSNPLIWLIVVSIMISRGLKQSGLGQRIGLLLIAKMGKRPLGLAYAITLADLLLAPMMPSNTARGGGVIHPIVRAIASAFGSSPEQGTQGRIGRYLALVNIHANVITSGMFVTATAPNPFVVETIAAVTGGRIHLTWCRWAVAMVVPGGCCLLLMPIVLQWLARPELVDTQAAVTYARTQLRTLGPLGRCEKMMLGTFALLIMLWANIPSLLFGPSYVLDATVVALIGLAILLLTKSIEWEDVLAEKSAWDTLMWFGALVMLADQLGQSGVMAWFARVMQSWMLSSHLNWRMALMLLLGIYVFSHYFFASTTAHVSAMLLAFLLIAAAVLPASVLPFFILLMAASTSIMMTLTHYATGTSPVIFGSGYISLAQWWLIGLIMCVFELGIYATIGQQWWRLVGPQWLRIGG